MKVSNMKCKLKQEISTLVICGSCMFEFSVSKDMKSMFHRKRGDNREGSDTFMSNSDCRGIEN